MSPTSSNYSHNFLQEFIMLYRSLPCLWQINCSGYRDRQTRNRAYDILVQKMREVNVAANRDEVTRRINIMRTAFRREYKKARKLENNYPQVRYKSSLWYYDLMKFVEEQKEQRITEENMTHHEIHKVFMQPNNYHEEILDDVKNEPLISIDPPELLPSSQSVSFPTTVVETNNSRDGTRRDSCSEAAKRKWYRVHEISRSSPPVNVEHEVTSRDNCSVHNYDFQTFGNYVVAKLRRSATRQSMIAEKIIADVLLRANLGTLTESTCLNENVDHGYLITDDK